MVIKQPILHIIYYTFYLIFNQHKFAFRIDLYIVCPPDFTHRVAYPPAGTATQDEIVILSAVGAGPCACPEFYSPDGRS